MLDAGILCSLEDLVGNKKQFAVRLQLKVFMPLCEKDWTQGFVVHLLNILELVLINMEKCRSRNKCNKFGTDAGHFPRCNED
jgi:hypothetical protein